MTALLLALCLAMVLAALLACQWQSARAWRMRHAAGAVLQAAQAQRMADAMALLHALPAAVIGTDHDGVVRYLNPRAGALGGLLPGDGVGQPVTQLLPLFHDGAPVDAARQVRDCLARQEVLEVARGAVLLRHLDG
ncbi:MAG: PAS domain-containing protein, partial [Janthinobacterium sp.]